LFLHGDLLGGEAENGDAAGFGADEEADAAAGATRAGVFGRMIAVVVEALGEMQDLGWAGLDAESTTFTFFGV
jgi:hypothetical protein